MSTPTPLDYTAHLAAARKNFAAGQEHLAALNMLVKAGLAKRVAKRFYLDRARVNALKG